MGVVEGERSRGAKILFWVALAPAVFYATITVAVILPSLLLNPSAKWQPPQALLIAFNAYSYFAMLFSAVLVWWCWRVFCGDPPRNPKLPSRRAVIWSLTGVAAYLLLILVLNWLNLARSAA